MSSVLTGRRFCGDRLSIWLSTPDAQLDLKAVESVELNYGTVVGPEGVEPSTCGLKVPSSPVQKSLAQFKYPARTTGNHGQPESIWLSNWLSKEKAGNRMRFCPGLSAEAAKLPHW